jgi:RND family efflux transporter MFP subunit
MDREALESPPVGHSEAVGATVHVHAPIDGVIIRRNASVGEKVDHATVLFEIVDIGNVWCEADIYEKDLTRVHLGQTVRLRVSAYPQTWFTGSIFYIGHTLEPETKTVKIMMELANPGDRLKPGMFASAHVITGRKDSVLVVSREAVLQDEQLQIVFVQEEDGYHRHVVKTGLVSGDRIEILSGLNPGDRVVTLGNYQLKSKLKMAGVDPHAGHSH